MRKYIFLALFSAAVLGASAQTKTTTTTDRSVVREGLYLKDRWVEQVLNDTTFDGRDRAVPTADAVLRFVAQRIANIGTKPFVDSVLRRNDSIYWYKNGVEIPLGTYLTRNTADLVFATIVGSLQNQYAAAQSASSWISGNFRAALGTFDNGVQINGMSVYPSGVSNGRFVYLTSDNNFYGHRAGAQARVLMGNDAVHIQTAAPQTGGFYLTGGGTFGGDGSSINVTQVSIIPTSNSASSGALNFTGNNARGNYIYADLTNTSTTQFRSVLAVVGTYNSNNPLFSVSATAANPSFSAVGFNMNLVRSGGDGEPSRTVTGYNTVVRHSNSNAPGAVYAYSATATTAGSGKAYSFYAVSGMMRPGIYRSDPSNGSGGDFYYNDSTGKFRAYEAVGGWKNMIDPSVISISTTDHSLEASGSVVNTKKAFTTLTAAATITWESSTGFNKKVVLNQAGHTLSIANPQSGSVYTLKIYQDATGGRTITTWPANTRWKGGTPPVLSTAPNALDIVSLIYDGTEFVGTYDTSFQ